MDMAIGCHLHANKIQRRASSADVFTVQQGAAKFRHACSTMAQVVEGIDVRAAEHEFCDLLQSIRFCRRAR